MAEIESNGSASSDPATQVFVGRTMRGALTAAYQQASVDRRFLVGTEYVLEAAAGRINTAGPGIVLLRRKVRQRLDGDSSAWRSSDEAPAMAARDSADLRQAADTALDAEVTRSLREAAWIARRKLRWQFGQPAPEWSSGAVAATRAALVDARSHGATHAHRLHLVTGLLADPTNRAHELLTVLGVDPSAVITDPLDEFKPDQDDPAADGAGVLLFFRALSKQVSWLDRMFLLKARARRFFLFLDRQTPVNLGVVHEAMRQAVRLDDPQVGSVHLLVAICAIDRQLRDNGWAFKPRLAQHNRAGQLLREAGVSYPTIVEQVLSSSVDRRATDSRPPKRRSRGTQQLVLMSWPSRIRPPLPPNDSATADPAPTIS